MCKNVPKVQFRRIVVRMDLFFFFPALKATQLCSINIKYSVALFYSPLLRTSQTSHPLIPPPILSNLSPPKSFLFVFSLLVCFSKKTETTHAIYPCLSLRIGQADEKTLLLAQTQRCSSLDKISKNRLQNEISLGDWWMYAAFIELLDFCITKTKMTPKSLENTNRELINKPPWKLWMPTTQRDEPTDRHCKLQSRP